MNRIIDNGLVIVLLLASATYALSALGPKSLRQRMYGAAARVIASAPAAWHLASIAQRLDRAASADGACGGCGTCGTDEAGGEQKPAGEVHVPIAKIGRRQ